MKKQVIAVDLDDVLGSQNEAIRLFINKRYGLNLQPNHYDIDAPYWGYWEKVWGVNAEEGSKRVHEFITSGGLLTQNLIPHAVEVIKRLEENYELVIVTARGDKHVEDTHKWLNQHFPNVFKGVHFTRVWDGDSNVTKAKICEEIGASYLIDDNIEHCELAAEAGVTALLFGEYGWNKNKPIANGVVRVKDWPGVEKYLNEISK